MFKETHLPDRKLRRTAQSRYFGVDQHQDCTAQAPGCADAKVPTKVDAEGAHQITECHTKGEAQGVPYNWLRLVQMREEAVEQVRLRRKKMQAFTIVCKLLKLY